MSREERKYLPPRPTGETQAYWDAANEGKLLVKRCTDCGRTHYYPRTICPHCFSDKTAWQEASGRGTIYTYSVLRRAPIPYAIAYVSLPEGVTMLTNIVDCDLDALSIGQEVRVVFKECDGGQMAPMFTPA